MMGMIFDGIQRPLDDIKKMVGSVFIPRGVDTLVSTGSVSRFDFVEVALIFCCLQSLDRKKSWEFHPGRFKVGDTITGGDIFGSVPESKLVRWL